MKHAKKILVAILTAAVIISNFAGFTITAKADTYLNTATGIKFVGVVEDVAGIPGQTVHVKLPVKAMGAMIVDPKIIVSTEKMPFTVSNITYTADGYTTDSSLNFISNYSTTYIEFDLKVKETASIGRTPIEVSVEFTADNQETGTTDLIPLKLPKLNLAISSEKEPAQLTVDNITLENAIIGNKTNLSFVIKNEGEITTHNTYFSISDEDYSKAGIIPEYSKTSQEVGVDGKLAPSDTYRVNLPVTISTDATAGNKTLTINMEYKDLDGTVGTNTSKIYINIEENSKSPKIEIVSTKHASELKGGDEFNLVTTLRNVGASEAKEIEIVVEGLGTTSFIPKYITETVSGGNLMSNKKVDVKIPLIVSKEALGGNKEISLKINYKDDKGVVYTTPTKLYLEVVAEEKPDDVIGKPNIVITNVSQSPNQPNAGALVNMAFDIENKSDTDISEIKVSVTNLSAANFSPVESEPYQYINKLAGGKKSRLTMPFTISDLIAEGANNLEIKIDYKDAAGVLQSDTATIYVLDIQNASSAASKPKLIISNFSTDIDELRAGSIFNFVYDIKNTHSGVNAKNITVTVSQAENIFSVTQGSNTSYITKIGAGEIVQNTIELKVKSDAVTKAYPITIKIDYEYDGAEANPETGVIGETVTETINLQAVENARPVVNNVFVGSWDSPMVNQPTALTFEFYNMGKSTLNNVYATVEGDFTLSTGTMYFIGNIEAGMPEYPELEVIPNIEGLAKGTLVITFEDSNGDEVKVSKEFEATVQGEYIPEFPVDDLGGGGIVEQTAKKPILPEWIFIVIQVAIFIIMVPVSRKVRLGLHRRKLRKQEDKEQI